MSSHGCTLKIAHQLQEQLEGEVHLHNLKHSMQVKLADYDRVIIGGSIHGGRIQKRISIFCEKRLDELLTKEVGLYICCMFEGEEAKEELRNAFPIELHHHAKVETIMGGEFTIDRMNLFEKFLVKQIAKTSHNVHKIDKEALQNFTTSMNRTTDQEQLS